MSTNSGYALLSKQTPDYRDHGKMEGGRKEINDHTLSVPFQFHRILNAFTIAQDKSTKQIVSQNFSKSINNRTHIGNATKINQYSQLSIQVT